MSMAEWCAWCNKVLRGKKSFFYGLCFDCRKSQEGKEYILQEEINLNNKEVK